MRQARGEFSSLARYQAAAIQGRGLYEDLVRRNATEQLAERQRAAPTREACLVAPVLSVAPTPGACLAPAPPHPRQAAHTAQQVHQAPRDFAQQDHGTHFVSPLRQASPPACATGGSPPMAIVTDPGTLAYCQEALYTLAQRTLRNYMQAPRGAPWQVGDLEDHLTHFRGLAVLDSAKFSITKRREGNASFAVIGEALRCLVDRNHGVHQVLGLMKEMGLRRALVDPINPSDPTRLGVIDRLKSARGIPLHSDPELAEDQVSHLRAQVRPLVAVMESKSARGHRRQPPVLTYHTKPLFFLSY